MQQLVSILLAVTLIGTAYSEVPVYLRTAPAYQQSPNVAVPAPSCASTCMPACQPTCIAHYTPVVPLSHVAPALPPALPLPSVAGSLISPIYQLPSPYYIYPPCMHSCMPSCSASCTTRTPDATTTVIPKVTQPETPPPSVVIPETTTPGPTTTTLPPTTTTVTQTTVPIIFTTTTTEEEITPPSFTSTVATLPPITVPQADPSTTTESSVIGCQNICVVKIAAGIPLESVLERVMAKCPTIQCTCPAGYNQCGNKTCCKI